MLINSSNHLTVGTSCGYSGAQTSGFIAIRALAASGRFDLVRLVLKCENPEARVYAAQAMLELQKSGIKLKADDEWEINRIRKLNVQIETCYGCLVMYKFAHEILGFKEDSPFNGDSIVSPSASFKYSWLQLKYGF